MTSVLEAGRRKRRLSYRLGLVALVLAPFALGAAVYLAFIEGSDDPDPPTVVEAAAAVRSPLLERPRAPRVRLSGVDAFRLRFAKPPRAGILVDTGTGEVLWRHRARTRFPMASLTKIMTALLVTERASPDERVRITPAVLRYSGSGVGVLPKGRRVRLETLLNGLMIVSGNDAAIALATHVSGSERSFVRLMNRRAKALGLRCTHFASSHGLENGNRSCARDLAVLARLAVRNRRIMRVARRRQVSLPFPIKGRRLFLSAHNPLFRARYRGARGLKTGYTEAAGRCFVGVARRRGRTLAVVLLGSPNPQAHSPRILDLGFRRG